MIENNQTNQIPPELSISNIELELGQLNSHDNKKARNELRDNDIFISHARKNIDNLSSIQFSAITNEKQIEDPLTTAEEIITINSIYIIHTYSEIEKRRKSLKNKYGVIQKYDLLDRRDPHYNLKFEPSISLGEVSIADIFQAKDIAQQNPISVYEHYLSRLDHTHLPNSQGEYDENHPKIGNGGTILKFIDQLSKKEVEKIQKYYPELTSEIIAPTLEIRHTILETIKNTRQIAFDPAHPEFPKFKDLISRMQKINSTAMNIAFIRQILQSDSSEGLRNSYKKIYTAKETGLENEFYEVLMKTVVNNYTGLTGDNLGTDILRQIEPEYLGNYNSEMTDSAKLLLKSLHSQSGKFILDKKLAQATDVDSLSVSYEKNGNETNVTVAFRKNIDDEEELSIKLFIKPTGEIDWSLLKLPSELPELYSALSHDALNSINSLHQDFNRPRLVVPNSAIKRDYDPKKRDEIYTLRKERNTRDDFPSPTPTDEVGAKINRPFAVIPSDIFSSLDQKTAESVSTIIDKYNTGLIDVRKVIVPANTRDKFVRLKSGNMRVILTIDTSTNLLVVVSAGSRDKIYERDRRFV